MNKRVAFIGHRDYFDPTLRDRLYAVVEKLIKDGCKFFSVGTHGMFDWLAFNVCQDLKRIYKDIEIEVVITSLNVLKPVIDHDEIYGDENCNPYKDVKTVMFDIENVYFKRQIVESNRHMVDNSEILICYVQPGRKGGAMLTFKYAVKQGKEIINLWRD